MLITTIDQVREVVGIAIRKEGTLELLKPYLDNVEKTLLQELIGNAQYTALGSATGEKPLELLRLARQTVVWNGYLDAWCHTYYQLGNTGLTRQKPKDTESLFRYQEDAINKDIVSKADRAVEQLMEFLELNQDDFQEWKGSASYASRFNHLIASAGDLHRSLPEITKSYRMYRVLRSYMPRVETTTVAVITGPDLFAQLKAKRKNGDEMDANYQKLLTLASDYVAPAALLDAFPWIRVTFTPDGIRVLSVMNNLQDQSPVTDQQTEWLMAILRERIEKARVALRKFLNDTASETVFADYFHSDLYRAPGSRSWKLPDNRGKKHFRL